MDVLMVLARELALLDEGRLDIAEIQEFKKCLVDLMERFLSMRHISEVVDFRANSDKLLPAMLFIFNRSVRDELVNRLIEHRPAGGTLRSEFDAFFSEAETETT